MDVFSEPVPYFEVMKRSCAFENVHKTFIWLKLNQNNCLENAWGQILKKFQDWTFDISNDIRFDQIRFKILEFQTVTSILELQILSYKFKIFKP